MIDYKDIHAVSIGLDYNWINEKMVNGSYYGDYESYIKNEQVSIAGEIALWRAVLLQAFIDLKIKSKNKKYNFAKRKAYEWFKLPENQEDVKEVCRLSGYEYRQAIKLADEIIKNNRL